MANSTSQTAKRFSTGYLVQLGLLSAIIILMSFTPLGYLKVGAISITFLTIPVVIGAIVLGPSSGAILGGVFGLTSLIQCFGMEPFGTFLFGLNPFATIFICLVPRILVGFFSGLIFKVMARFDKTKLASYGIASLSAALLNTLLFMTSLFLFFWNNNTFIDNMASLELPVNNILLFFIAFVGVNGLIEACVTFVVGGAIAKAIHSFKKRSA